MNLLGILLVPLIDLVNRKISDSDLRFWVSLLICSIVGVGINFVDNNGFHFQTLSLGFESISTSILSIFAVAQITYKAGYEDSDAQKFVRGKDAMKDKHD